LASREGAAEGGFKGGIPPRPSVPPERLPAEASAQAGSGGGQFRSKNVRAELYNSTSKTPAIWRVFLIALRMETCYCKFGFFKIQRKRL